MMKKNATRTPQTSNLRGRRHPLRCCRRLARGSAAAAGELAAARSGSGGGGAASGILALDLDLDKRGSVGSEEEHEMRGGSSDPAIAVRLV
jgi:hypothetical protein